MRKRSRSSADTCSSISRKRCQPISLSSGSCTLYSCANRRRYGTAQIAMTSSRSTPILILAALLRPLRGRRFAASLRSLADSLVAAEPLLARFVLSCDEVQHARQGVAPVATRVENRETYLPLARLYLREDAQQRDAPLGREISTEHQPQLGPARADLGRAGSDRAQLHLDTVEKIS